MPRGEEKGIFSRLSVVWENYTAVLLTVVLFIGFNLYGDSFDSLSSILNILLYNTGLMLAVVGVSFVMITGDIDFSIGYQISLISAIISTSAVRQLPAGAVIMCALLSGLLCGILNGVLVAYLKIAPFAATIATQVVFHGLSYILTGGSMVSSITHAILNIKRTTFLLVRIDVWLVAVSFIVLELVIRRTMFGKHLRAIGLNETVAANAGVNTRLVRCVSYGISGFFYALAALVLISKRGYAGSEIGIGMEINTIVAAYIGGILVLAERQNVSSLLFGTFVFAVIENGLSEAGVSSYFQYVALGVILIVSIMLHKKDK